MKFLFAPLCTIAFLVAGCSQSAEMAAPKLIEITGNDEMKFDVTSFEVKAGQKVTVTLTDIGELPKEAMAHNWVLLEKGTDAAALVKAGEELPATDYIPPDQATRVLAKTKLLGPGDSDSITFTAPIEPGPYEYLCAFPDHYAGGMKGIMTVTPSAK